MRGPFINQTLRCVAVGLFAVAAGDPAGGQVQATEADKLVTADADTNDRVGFALDLSGNKLAVGARWDSETANKAGAAYVYTFTEGGWNEQFKLLAADGAADDEFGYAVGLSGNLVAVGAPFDDDHGARSGSVYVYRMFGNGWSAQAKLTALDAAAYSEFGADVAASGDVIAVGAPFDDAAGTNAGAVYIYRFDGANWNEEAKLLAPDPRLSDNFGAALALNGSTLLVGAPNADDGFSNAGLVFVFDYNGTDWIQVAQLQAADRASNDNFGSSVAMNSGRAICGAPGDDDGGTSAGSAYAFARQDGVWSQTTKLTASAPAAYDGFGERVAIWGDAAIVSCPFDDDAGTNSGSAFLYYFDGQDWQQQVKLLASDGAATDGFGRGVAIGKKGGLVGAPFDDDGGPSSGAAYFFGGIEDCDQNGSVDLVDLIRGSAADNDDDGTPDLCCPGDVDGDGQVFLTDLAIFLAMYGTFTPDPLASDMDGNGYVGLEDLQIVLTAFGRTCP